MITTGIGDIHALSIKHEGNTKSQMILFGNRKVLWANITTLTHLMVCTKHRGSQGGNIESSWHAKRKMTKWSEEANTNFNSSRQKRTINIFAWTQLTLQEEFLSGERQLYWERSSDSIFFLEGFWKPFSFRWNLHPTIWMNRWFRDYEMVWIHGRSLIWNRKIIDAGGWEVTASVRHRENVVILL